MVQMCSFLLEGLFVMGFEVIWILRSEYFFHTAMVKSFGSATPL